MAVPSPAVSVAKPVVDDPSPQSKVVVCESDAPASV